MKKSGYTLAEILIALAIAGIVAGLVLPMAGKIRPNANKMAFLHTYDSIVQLTHSIAANETFYPEINVVEDEDDKINYANYPLWNIHPKSPDGNIIYEQAKKYCQILAEGLKADSNACLNNAITPFGNQKSFTTPNGVDFWVNTERGELDEENDGIDDYAIYQSSVHFDVNGIDQGENCIYDAGTCPHPDRFTLFVASDGKVVAADKMSQHYLNTRTNFRFNKDEVPNTNELTILTEPDRKKKIIYIDPNIPNQPNDENDYIECGGYYPDGKRNLCVGVIHRYNGEEVEEIYDYGIEIRNENPDKPLVAPYDIKYKFIVCTEYNNIGYRKMDFVIKKGETRSETPEFPLTGSSFIFKEISNNLISEDENYRYSNEGRHSIWSFGSQCTHSGYYKY